MGRERYVRAVASPEAREGSRDGYREATIKTTTGPVTPPRPKLRGTSEAFVSRLLGSGVTKTHTLDSLVIAWFIGGVSTGTWRPPWPRPSAAGHRVALDGVADRDRDDQWQQRRLDDVELDYLFLDAILFRYHLGAAAEPVLAAWGITTAGKPVFVGRTPRPPSPPTPGRPSWPISAPAGWPARCWLSPTAPLA